MLRFGASPDSIYDGRSYCAVNNSKGYIATSAGIFVLDVNTMTTTGPIQGTQSSAKGDYNSLYTLQCGDMVRFGQYVFAVQQGVGLHVIDPETDEVVSTLSFPDIVTVFVTATGNLYVANNSRSIYDFGTGPFVADFTRVNPVTLAVDEVYELDGAHGALNSWGAWRARMLCVDPVHERVYYNYDEFQNHISCYDFTTRVLTDHFIDLPEAAEINWDGTHNHQGLYASALSFDPHTGDMVVQTTEAAPMYAYQIFNHNWVLFYDAQSRQLKREVRLQDAYWFPAIALYPDACSPTITIGDMRFKAGQRDSVDLLQAVQDADNMPALAVTTATSANEAVASVKISGLRMVITALSPGTTTITAVTDSNGKFASCDFTVTVTSASVPGDVNMDGKVAIDDVTTLIDVLLGSVLCNYDPAAADVNNDGRITITDVTALIDMLLFM